MDVLGTLVDSGSDLARAAAPELANASAALLWMMKFRRFIGIIQINKDDRFLMFGILDARIPQKMSSVPAVYKTANQNPASTILPMVLPLSTNP